MFKKLKQFIRRITLKGGNVECCLCGQKFITFLPSGDEIRAHSKCPGCYSIDRHRQLWLILKPLIEDRGKALRLLHIAPENPLSKQLLKLNQIEYLAIDKFVKGYSYPSHVREMDLTSLQFGNNTFDIFICSHVLEHIKEDIKAISELFRVLKPGGTGFIIIPYFPELQTTYEDTSYNTPELRKTHFGQADHVRKYGRDFISKLKEAGFQTEMISFDHKFTYEQKVRMGLLNAEIFFQVKKSVNV